MNMQEWMEKEGFKIMFKFIFPALFSLLFSALAKFRPTDCLIGSARVSGTSDRRSVISTFYPTA